ncbi:hypothetical protein HOLleu_17792 [Holothuria leucospilota]|uniref:LRAT domain-containing protein n=1 Tax=Holothuria leucospilota TaxID=206669 RepID=A0A9Q1H902_HOLLE|nr:hypothetical protein HOLleu_17792 [Holothuria leucospilota]
MWRGSGPLLIGTTPLLPRMFKKMRMSSMLLSGFQKKICKNTKKKFDLLGNCCYSPMYKFVYPKEIEEQNPPDLVMLRASTMMSLDIRYSLFVDNNEHFATFCKTGSHKSNQLFQYSVRMHAWIARILVAFLHIAFVVSFSEMFEWFVPHIDEDWLGFTIHCVFECLTFLMIIFITYKIDTPKQNFKRSNQSGCTLACKRAVIKSLMQSVTLIGFVTLFGVFVVRLVAPKNGKKWSVKKRVGIEMGLGFVGGVIGNMIGFIFCHFIPYPCCRTVIREEDAGTETKHVEEGKEGHPQSQSTGSTPVPKRSAIASDISETTYHDQGRLSGRKEDAKDEKVIFKKSPDDILQDDEIRETTISGSKIKLNIDGDTSYVRRETPKSSREGEEGESETDSTQFKIVEESFPSSTEDVSPETEAEIHESKQDETNLDDADM